MLSWLRLREDAFGLRLCDRASGCDFGWDEVHKLRLCALEMMD